MTVDGIRPGIGRIQERPQRAKDPEQPEKPFPFCYPAILPHIGYTWKSLVSQRLQTTDTREVYFHLCACGDGLNERTGDGITEEPHA